MTSPGKRDVPGKECVVGTSPGKNPSGRLKTQFSGLIWAFFPPFVATEPAPGIGAAYRTVADPEVAHPVTCPGKNP